MDLLVFFWNLQGSHFISPKVELGQGFPWGLSAVPGSQEHRRGRAGWCPHRKVAGKGSPGLSGECLSKMWIHGSGELCLCALHSAPAHSLGL